MAEMRFKGESLSSALPAEYVMIKEIYGTEIFRLVGTEGQISESTKILEEIYPDSDKTVFCDAIWLGTSRLKEGGDYENMYELIVVRRI